MEGAVSQELRLGSMELGTHSGVWQWPVRTVSCGSSSSLRPHSAGKCQCSSPGTELTSHYLCGLNSHNLFKNSE